MNSNPLIYAIIPAINEEDTIGNIIDEINNLSLTVKVIVLDDGSSDGTSLVAKKKGAEVIKHYLNLGQWAALKTLFYICILNKAEIVVTLDADGQHFVDDFISIINPIITNEADLVIGSRFKKTYKTNMPFHRFIGIKIFNILMKLKTGLILTDCTSGYRGYNLKTIKKILNNINEKQYGSLESLIVANSLKTRIKEIPIKTKNSSKTTKGKFIYAYNLLRTVLISRE